VLASGARLSGPGGYTGPASARLSRVRLGFMMRILLANPPPTFSYRVLGVNRPPLGLAYMASILRDDYDVQIVDFSVEPRHWSEYPYRDFDIVGISVDTSRCPVSFEIAQAAKDQGTLVVVGGPHVSFMDDEALATGVVDYVVRNEGEYSFRALVDFIAGSKPLQELRGISYLDGRQVVRAPDAPFIHDLDSLPFPARDLLSLHLYRERMNGRLMTTMVTSRGCPFNCDFCSSSEFFGVRWRARSVENMLDEIDILYNKYGYRALSFVDDNFTLNPARAIEVSEKIRNNGWDLIWAAMTRVDTVVKHPEMVRAMAQAGFSWTFIGFESGNQEILDAYGKKAGTDDARQAIAILKDNNVKVTGAFILGAVDETEEMVQQTIDFAKELDPTRAQFSLLTPYPGARLYERVVGRLLTKDWNLYSGMYPTIKLDHITPERLHSLLISAYSSFYGRPGKAFENSSYIFRMVPSITKYLANRLVVNETKSACRACVSAGKQVANLYRMLT
jgi:anaerobic magnesium-protoporphyrin IX monomethyl ester cyclase